MKLLRQLTLWFAWREVRDTGIWVYSENRITGQRKALRISRCFQPLDWRWLMEGRGEPRIISDRN